MNHKALQKLSYGVYIITTADSEKKYGCVANSVVQITSSPASVAVSINHDNATHDKILETGKFSVTILPTDVDPSIIGGFGYRSSRDVDKFEGTAHTMRDGLPVPDVGMAWMTCQVKQTMDAGSHTIILGEIINCDVTRGEAIAMTYHYYHAVIKGKSPKNAPTYVAEDEKPSKIS